MYVVVHRYNTGGGGKPNSGRAQQFVNRHRMARRSTEQRFDNHSLLGAFLHDVSAPAGGPACSYDAQ